MTETAANFWFCENRGNHTVFKREFDHYILPELSEKKPAHKLKCEGWLKEEKRRKEEQEETKSKE
jgi:hypothetical protein